MGSVARVTKLATGKQFAMKTVMFGNISREQRSELINEIQIMKMLDHPNIIKLYESTVINEHFSGTCAEASANASIHTQEAQENA